MQYFAPRGEQFFGDAMPFFDGVRFHVFYLLDRQHHQYKSGLGGHEWAHAWSRDLTSWRHEPVAIALTEPGEGSICTGSVFASDDRLVAYYATRTPGFDQYLSYAVSTDGVSFAKRTPNPLLTAPDGLLPRDFRDPCVFRGADGRLQMLVTSRVAEFPLHERGGCIVRFSSDNLTNWRYEGVMAVTGGPAGEACVPECPDYFECGGRYYLLYGPDHGTRYLTAEEPYGPWRRPAAEVLGTSWMLSVMKTAAFHGGRRIGVGWIGCREGDRDDGRMQWGGNAVFREVECLSDGGLALRFVDEMLPGQDTPVAGLRLEALSGGVAGTVDGFELREVDGIAESVLAVRNVPADCRIRCSVRTHPGTRSFGLGLRGSGRLETLYPLTVDLNERRATLQRETIFFGAMPTDRIDLDIVLRGTIVDVSVGGRFCLTNRLYDLRGGTLFFFAEGGAIDVRDLTVRPWLDQPPWP